MRLPSILLVAGLLTACSLQNTAPEAVIAAATLPAPTIETIDITVEVDDYTLRGRPWDGIGHIGGLVGPMLGGLTFQSPPDIYVCIVRLMPDPTTDCNLEVDEDGKPLAPFHDARLARFSLDNDYGAPVGLLILDQDDIGDGKLDDSIEFFILSDAQENPEKIRVLDGALRKLIEERAATRIEVNVLDKRIPIDLDTSEGRRRHRGPAIIERGSCDPEATGPCRLDQSLMTLSITPR
jgi:hypothetical protein